MDKSVINQVLNKKYFKDYTYAIFFLLISSFFALVVIRPVLSIAIELQKESEELLGINTIFDKNISKIIMIQSDLEEIRTSRYLLEEALPEKPKARLLIEDIKKIISENGIELLSFSTNDIVVKDDSVTSKTLKTINIVLSIKGDFAQCSTLIDKIIQSRRLKTIHNIKIDKNLQNTEGAELTISITGETFYY